MSHATKWCFTLLAVFFGSFLFADSAWAWGPATHLQYGLNVLSRLDELTEMVRALLTSQTLPFLYGCVSADIVLVKKLGRAKTHSHNWNNGLRLMHEATSPRLRAFAMGYGTHLAADSISHNCFVPSKTIESYSSGLFKHLYWELRFDKKIATQQTWKIMGELAKADFSDCDEHLSERVPMRIMDFSFNKRVFDRLLALQGIRKWQTFLDHVSRRGAWPLRDPEVAEFSDRSMTAVISYLNHQADSKFIGTDPNGRERLKAARILRNHLRGRLSRNSPTAASRVLVAAESFSREPFTVIDADQHRIS